MEIAWEDHDGVTVVRLNGHLETDTLPALRERMTTLVECGARRICLNCKRLSFITSTALGYLIKLNKMLAARGGELAFSEPSDFFAATVRTLELHHLFEIADTDADAIDHLGGGVAESP